MPKRKTKKRTGKRKSKKAGNKLRRTFSWLCLLSFLSLAIASAYKYKYNEGEMPPSIPPLPSGAEIPVLTVPKNEQIIIHEGYTVSYNSDYKIANWVAYELTAQEASSTKTGRSDKFTYDPSIDKMASASNEDYSRSGYDKGHLAPAGDMKWSAKAMRESFYLTNICPQKPALNRGEWKELEETARIWAKEYGSLYIICGPVIDKNLKRLGKNRVGIPKQFYKVICNPHQGEAIAFLFENKGYKNTPLQKFVVTVDSIETITGIDFFPQFPDDLEAKMESAVDLGAWGFSR